MKTLVLVIALSSLCGCSQSATVTSSDGTRVIGQCFPDTWVDCVAGLCPYGYVVVVDPLDGERGIIKCK